MNERTNRRIQQTIQPINESNQLKLTFNFHAKKFQCDSISFSLFLCSILCSSFVLLEYLNFSERKKTATTLNFETIESTSSVLTFLPSMNATMICKRNTEFNRILNVCPFQSVDSHSVVHSFIGIEENDMNAPSTFIATEYFVRQMF